MIGQGDSQNPPPPPPPPPPPGASSVDMLACSSFAPSSNPPPLANPADRRPCPKAPHPAQVLKCPRCESLDTKFCYYNNYSLTQPRYFCKNCKRYWTAGGALRNVPVGGGLRKNKRSKLKLAAAADADAVTVAQALAGQQQYQARVPAPVARAPAETPKGNHATSMSSSGSTALPSGMSSNLSRFESNVYSFDASRGAHSSGIRSSADLGGGATIDYSGSATSENGGAATAAPSSHHHPGSNFYGEARRLPQFYSTSLPPSHQYSNEAASYGVNYSFLPASNNSNLHPNDGAAGPSPSSNVNHNDGANPMITNKSMPNGEIKEERDEASTTNPYDWQLISEGLFNGGGDGLLYMPGGNWPDFSQFNDAGTG